MTPRRRDPGRRPVRRRRFVPPPADDEPTPRVLGRVEWLRGEPWFLPARRFRATRRPLAMGRGTAPEPGDYVIAECPWDENVAHLIEVLGREDDPLWDNQAVLSRARWPRRFSHRALAEAEAAEAPREGEPGRVDLRDRVTFTMDPEDAADFDDALSWRPLAEGRWEIGVHIADVGHYVPAGSALDVEARERATSVYLAGEAVPMLPERLSSDLCSLRPHEDRYAVSVLAEVDDGAGVHAVRIHKSLIRSRQRLSYEQGDAALAGREPLEPEVGEALAALDGLARALLARRRGRGGLDLDTSEVRARVGADGRPTALERKHRLATHRLIEEFMLLANTLVGEEAERRGGPFLFRVHDPPPQGKLEMLELQLRALGLPRLGGEIGIARELQKLLDAPLPDDRRRLLHQLVLRSLSRAAYRERDSGHFGLALRDYCHFTSPIRRYPDLFNHRQVAHWLAAGGTGASADRRRAADEARDLEETFDGGVAGLARHTTAQEVAAQDAERESVRVKSLRFMEGFLGEEYEGVITGVVPRGVFVEFEAPPVEGFCRVAEAVDDDFRLDDSGVQLIGRRTRRRFRLGDRVRVAVARVDVPARELELALVAPRPRPAPGGRQSGRRRPRRRMGGKK